MQKVNVTEQELRKIISKALITEVGVDVANPSTSFKKRGKVAFDPTARLKMLNKLVGDSGGITADAWWQNVIMHCSPASAKLTSAGGVAITSDPRFQNDIALFGIDDAAAFKALLNFAIVSVLCGKKVQAKAQNPLIPNAADPNLALTPKKTYDMIQKAGSSNLFVYPSQPLVDQCNALNKALDIKAAVLTYDDPTFVTEILSDDATIDQVVNNGMQDISSGAAPAANTCFTSLPEATKLKYQADQKALVDAEIDSIEQAMKDLSGEVYEAYLYTPLLAPRVWLNPEIISTSPLYTPWRMTWSACNLIGEALSTEGKTYGSDVALYAMLTNLYKMVRTGTSINVFDAPGQDFAMGEGESLNEARFMVGSVLLTEDTLRRVIRAALQSKSLLTELPTPRVPGAGAAPDVAKGAEELGTVGRAARVAGAIIDPMGAARLALAAINSRTVEGINKLDADLKEATTAIIKFVDSVKKGTIVTDVVGTGLPDVMKTYVPQLTARLVPKYRELVSSISADPFAASALGPDGMGKAAELAAQTTISLESAQKIAEAFNLLVIINLKKAAGLNVSDEMNALDKALLAIDSDDISKLSKKILEDPEIITRGLGQATARDNAGSALATAAAGPGGKISEMKESAIEWLQLRVRDFDPQSKITVVPTAEGRIDVLIPKPIVAPSGSTLSITPDAAGNMIPLRDLDKTLTADLSTAVRGTGAVAARSAYIARYKETFVKLTDEQIAAVQTAAIYLSSDASYAGGIRVVVGGAYESAGTVLTKGVINGTAAGLVPEEKSSRLTSRTVMKALDRITGSDPSEGIIPFIPGVNERNFPFGLETASGVAVKPGELTRLMWQSLKSEVAIVKTGQIPVPGTPGASNLATRGDKANALAKAVGFAMAYAGAFGYESQMAIPRLKSLAAQRTLQRIGQAISPAAKVKVTRAVTGKWGGLLGTATSSLVLAGLGYLIGKATGASMEKSESGDLPITKFSKTVYTEMMRGPIDIQIDQGHVKLMSGGLVPLVMKGLITSLSDKPNLEDFYVIYGALDANNPAGSAKKMLIDSLSNMYKNAIIKGGNDESTLIKFFPEIAPSTSGAEAALEQVVAATGELADKMAEQTKVTFEELNREGGSFSSARAARDEVAASRAMLERLITQYKQESSRFGVSLENAPKLDNLEATRLAVINDTIASINSNSEIAPKIRQWREEVVPDTFGREDSTIKATSNWTILRSIMSTNEDFFDFSTTYLEFAGAKDPTFPMIAAAKGAYGLEFTGDLDDPVAKQALLSLKEKWEESGKLVGEVLATLAEE